MLLLSAGKMRVRVYGSVTSAHTDTSIGNEGKMLFQPQVLLMSVLALASPQNDMVARSYECGGGGGEEEEEEEELETYCLAKCEERDSYNRVSGALDPVDYSEEWCEERARKYCHKYGFDLDNSCFGERLED